MTLQKTSKRKASNKALEASKSFPKGDSLPLEKNINTGDILPDNALGNLAKLSDSSLSFSEVVVRLKNLDPETFKKGLQALSKDIHSKDGTLAEKEIEAALKGIRGALVKESQPKLPHEILPKPWPEEVRLIEVVRELESVIKKVMWLSPENVTAVAYFCVASWFTEYLDYAPYMVITAPSNACGKSTLVKLMFKLCRKPYVTSGDTNPSSIYRTIEEHEPTIFLDEIDTYLKEKSSLLGILKGGIDRELGIAVRSRPTPSGYIVEDRFSTFGFKVFSGIAAKNIDTALESRSIVVTLQKLINAEKVTYIDDLPESTFKDLQQKLYRLSLQYGEYLKTLKGEKRPKFPKSLPPRDRNKWQTIFALADLAGEGEGERVRAVATTIANVKKEASWDLVLLADAYELALKAGQDGGFFVEGYPNRITLVKDSKGRECIKSSDLYNGLILNPEKRWGTFHYHRNAITQCHLSKTLTGFEIEKVQIKPGNVSAFVLGSLAAVVERYARDVDAD